MLRKYCVAAFLLIGLYNCSIAQTTIFESSNGKKGASYAETIAFYQQLDKASNLIKVAAMGQTDAGFPLHLVTISPDGNHDPVDWQRQERLVILVNNGIHPGEPDGIDASLMLARDISKGRIVLPENTVLCIIPVYNIGGAINRSAYSRVNQNGPDEYGFRGNAQNLDLNRDFTKADSREAMAFSEIFHLINPQILIDNHVSDGADFQHVFTLLTTQYNKLGGPLESFLRQSLEPAVYAGMQQKGWAVFPYVNFDAYDLSRGMTQFYESPRYSSGYAALFGCIGFVPETHMLKPYPQRVQSTYDFMATVIKESAARSAALKKARKAWQQELQQADSLALTWKPDRTRYDSLTFLGYARDTVVSEVTGLPAMRYRRDMPFSGPVKFYSYFLPDKMVRVPRAYVIPVGWHRVLERLKQQGVKMQFLTKDSTVDAEVLMIEKYQAASRPYEGHFRLSNVEVRRQNQQVTLRKGDAIVLTQQPARRYLVEMLEPTGDDSFFSWNFFDAILQQKEGYSDYRWEEVAATWLKDNPKIREALEEKKRSDAAFAKNSSAILNWVYKQSPWYEPAHMRYPVFRLP